VRPFGALAAAAASIQELRAFGDLPTRRSISELESEWFEDALREQEYKLWDGTSDQTGFDDEGVLRCGVCGARMQLNKKDRAAKRTVEQKLDKHMRELHDREQRKRLDRLRSTSRAGKAVLLKRQSKFAERLCKYEAATVEATTVVAQSVAMHYRRRNDQAQVLRELGVRCAHADDVDARLSQSARKWMAAEQLQQPGGLRPRARGRGARSQGHDADADAVRAWMNEDGGDAAASQPAPRATAERGDCLVVVSEDSDFAGLLRMARKEGFVAITAARPGSLTQTRALREVADVVLLAPSLFSDDDDGLGDDGSVDAPCVLVSVAAAESKRRGGVARAAEIGGSGRASPPADSGQEKRLPPDGLAPPRGEGSQGIGPQSQSLGTSVRSTVRLAGGALLEAVTERGDRFLGRLVPANDRRAVPGG
jgi:hypothetical protein